MRGAILAAAMLAFVLGQASAVCADDAERVFIVKDYRFLPETGGNEDAGQSLCGTRCNALSVDYLNFVEPGGWRMIKITEGREIVVDLKNPFMVGRCVCVVDEYEVKIDELNRLPVDR